MRTFEKTDDPFTRRKTTPKMVTPLNVSKSCIARGFLWLQYSVTAVVTSQHGTRSDTKH